MDNPESIGDDRGVYRYFFANHEGKIARYRFNLRLQHLSLRRGNYMGPIC